MPAPKEVLEDNKAGFRKLPGTALKMLQLGRQFILHLKIMRK
jgi:hypothetical protein